MNLEEAQQITPPMLEQTVIEAIGTNNTEKQSRFRILMVDDDGCFVNVAAQILASEHNFIVQTANSVDLALEAISKQAFDAIICDYEMPQKNGLELLRELRGKKNEIPFVMFTGKGREEVVVTALNLGTDRYVNKHGSPEAVYAELSDAVLKSIERK